MVLEESGYFVGIDIGGTFIKTLIVDINKNIVGKLMKLSFKNGDSALEEVNKNIIDSINMIISNNNLSINNLKGIGIASAAMFERQTGVITIWPNRPLWNKYPIVEHLQKHYKVPIKIEDDASAGALGELYFGSGKGHKNFAYITISTGVGCGLVLDEKLYTGTLGWAGEIGHIPIAKDGPKCVCGNKGCLQALISGKALYKRGLQLMSEEGVNTPTKGLQDMISQTNSQSKWVQKLFNEAAENLAQILIYLTMTLDISLIILGGGVSKTGDLLMIPLKKQVIKGLGPFNRNLSITVTSLTDENGVLGAISQFYKN